VQASNEDECLVGHGWRPTLRGDVSFDAVNEVRACLHRLLFQKARPFQLIRKRLDVDVERLYVGRVGHSGESDAAFEALLGVREVGNKTPASLAGTNAAGQGVHR
jgi:hypothetical protein